MDQIVAKGKGCNPILISQLTTPRIEGTDLRLLEPDDRWDIAYFILNDLFTDSDWTTFNMRGLEALKGTAMAHRRPVGMML